MYFMQGGLVFEYILFIVFLLMIFFSIYRKKRKWILIIIAVILFGDILNMLLLMSEIENLIYGDKHQELVHYALKKKKNIIEGQVIEYVSVAPYFSLKYSLSFDYDFGVLSKFYTEYHLLTLE